MSHLKSVSDLIWDFKHNEDMVFEAQKSLFAARANAVASRKRLEEYLKGLDCGRGLVAFGYTVWLDPETEQIQSIKCQHAHDMLMPDEAVETDEDGAPLVAGSLDRVA